jgi:hypothetical protein
MTIPPKPKGYAADAAPAFVELKLSSYKTAGGALWWPTRPQISPRLQLVHTNGATGEGSIESAINWGNAKPYENTHPHYQVDRHRAAKFVPSDRKGIGNATALGAQGDYGNVSDWSIVIETADEGYPTPGEAGGFIGDQVEMIAQILAYESILWHIPLSYPGEWWQPGTACHTEPFGFPYWTIHTGKVCPGYTKKQQMRTVVLPRAREIAAAWTAPEPEEPVLKLFNVKPSALNAGPLFASGDGITAVWISGEQWAKLGNLPATDLVERAACRQWTLVGDCPDGYRGIWAQDALT